MKPFFHILFFCTFLFIFANCANGKKLQEEPPVDLEQAYYTSYTGAVKGATSGFNLFIPLAEGRNIQMDTVYFRGRKAVVQRDSLNPDLYVATFKIPSKEAKAPELIMHEDPKMEYGNPVPERLEKMPFDMENDEAVVQYTQNGKVKYFKITGLQNRDSTKVKIKKPENIRH